MQTLAQMLALDPAEFEIWIGMMFQLNGYRVRNTQYSGDHGVDIEVSKPPVNSGLVQCKRYRGTVGERVVRELYGTLIHERGDRAWLATTGAISRQARDWANGKPIELWDGQKLVELAMHGKRSMARHPDASRFDNAHQIDNEVTMKRTVTDRPLVFAHRGAKRVAPENTLPAFEAAIRLGADGVELDVQYSSDGKLVIFHDLNLEKTSNGAGRRHVPHLRTSCASSTRARTSAPSSPARRFPR